MKYLIVFLSAIFKFIAGPTMSFAFGFSIYEAMLLTLSASMVAVLLGLSFSTLITKIRKRFFSKERMLFTDRNRRFVKFWRKYGIKGVAALAPIIFTPLGGTLIILSLGGIERFQVFLVMFVSLLIWTPALTFIVYQFGIISFGN